MAEGLEKPKYYYYTDYGIITIAMISVVMSIAIMLTMLAFMTPSIEKTLLMGLFASATIIGVFLFITKEWYIARYTAEYVEARRAEYAAEKKHCCCCD